MKPEPNFRLVEIDHTSYCNEHWLASNRVSSVKAVYLYDATSHTYCCELTPSYAMHLLRYNVEGEGDSEALQDLSIDLMQYSEIVEYHHCKNVDNRNSIPAASLVTSPIDEDMSYDELLQEVIEYNQANHLL